MQALHLLSKELHFLFEAQLSSIWWTLCNGEGDISKELIKIQIRGGVGYNQLGKTCGKLLLLFFMEHSLSGIPAIVCKIKILMLLLE